MGSAADLDRAEDVVRQSQRLAEDLGDRRGIAKGLRGLGMVLAMGRGDVAGALPMFEQAVALLEELGDRTETVEALVALGNGHRFSGDPERGRTDYLRAIDLTSADGNRPVTTGLMLILAAVEGDMGHHERVATIWGAATAAREASGAVQPPMAARLIGDPLAAARAAIGDGEVDRALDAGRAMDEEAMLAYAYGD